MATYLDRERAHGDYLAAGDPVAAWNWSSPAGQRRAARRAAVIADAAGLRPGVRALEVGCGTGLFSAAFAATGCDLTAIDVSDALIDQARRRELAGVRFLAVPLEAYDGDPCDAIVGSSVLHHLPMPAACLELRRRLRPGGRIAFAEPNLVNPIVWTQFRGARRYFPDVSPDEQAFTRWTAARWLRDAGFVDVAIVPFDFLYPGTPAPLIPIVSRVGAALERIPIACEFAGSILVTARAER